MRDIFAVISEKEAELKKLQGDLETLRAAARLLTDENDADRKVSVIPDSGSTISSDAAPKEARAAAGGLKRFP